ncbi:hypothetical protein J2T17_001176 [Paenibacillus mucilaginosus]
MLFRSRAGSETQAPRQAERRDTRRLALPCGGRRLGAGMPVRCDEPRARGRRADALGLSSHAAARRPGAGSLPPLSCVARRHCRGIIGTRCLAWPGARLEQPCRGEGAGHGKPGPAAMRGETPLPGITCSRCLERREARLEQPCRGERPGTGSLVPLPCCCETPLPGITCSRCLARREARNREPELELSCMPRHTPASVTLPGSRCQAGRERPAS